MRNNLIKATIIGFITGLSLIPVAENIHILRFIPSPFLVLLVGFPLLCVVGMATARIIGKKIPFIVHFYSC